MGVYNCDQYLPASIESLLSQTYKNIEIIICDDGSCDKTYNIALSYAKEHSNIVLLKNEHNIGLNETLNRCLKVATGEYIARMDGDDMSFPLRIEKQVAFLNNNNSFDIVSTAMIRFDDDGPYAITEPKAEPLKQDFIKGTPFSHPACMIRKRALDKVGGYSVSPRLIRVEDYHLWFKMYSIGCKGYNLTEPLYYFRDDKKSFQRRNLKARKNEIYVRYIGFKMLKLPFYYLVLSVTPFFVYIMPPFLYNYFHKRKCKRYE